MGLFFNNQDIANAGVTEKAVLYSRSRFSWELSEIGAAKLDGARLLRGAQPPSGGCVLKQLDANHLRHVDFSRLQAAVC